MPIRPKSICRHPGCGALIDAPGHCAKHFKSSGWDHKKKTTERGYGAAWRKIRDYVLKRDNYLCQSCVKSNKITPASEVDHIINKARGGSDDQSNLQSLCKQCHRDKTAMDRIYN